MPNLHAQAILQIIPTLDAGGAERTTVDIAEALISQGAIAHIATNGGRLVETLKQMGAQVHILPVASKNPFVLIANIFRIIALVKAHNIQLIHARSRAPAWSALCAARLCAIPFVTTYHGIYNSKNAMKRFYNSVMARGDCVIANSKFTAEHILKQHPKAESRIQIIPRGTDFTRFNCDAISEDRLLALSQIYKLSQNHKILLLPARLTRWKGQLILIQALGELKSKGILPDHFLCILAGDAQGRNDYVQELYYAIHTHQLNDHVIIHDHITDIAAAYALSYAIVVPSTDPEAFGRVPVEAQAMKKLIIVTDHGAPKDTVITDPQDQKTGWRVEPNNCYALTQAIVAAYALSPEDYKRMTQRAYDYVSKHFALPQMLQSTLKIYETMIKTQST